MDPSLSPAIHQLQIDKGFNIRCATLKLLEDEVKSVRHLDIAHKTAFLKRTLVT